MQSDKKPEWQQIRDDSRSKEAAKTKALRQARMAAEAAAAAAAAAAPPRPAKKSRKPKAKVS